MLSDSHCCIQISYSNVFINVANVGQSSLCFIPGKVPYYMQILRSFLNGASFVILNVQIVV